jgi:DNA-binding CsgD family transcriptional regulator
MHAATYEPAILAEKCHRHASAVGKLPVVIRRTRVRPLPLPAPPGLAALESDDGNSAVLSFELARGPRGCLTPAESEVVAHLLRGDSSAEIATQRGTSLHTVNNQVASIFRKLGVRSRLELVALAPLFGASGRE